MKVVSFCNWAGLGVPLLIRTAVSSGSLNTNYISLPLAAYYAGLNGLAGGFGVSVEVEGETLESWR